MSNVFDTVLLTSLPGAGKSAIRKFLKEADRSLKEELHFGECLMMDDLQYVILFNQIDEELESMKEPKIFYPNGQPHYDSRDYGTLTMLLKEDYKCLKEHTIQKTNTPALYLLERIDLAADKLGLGRRFASLNDEVKDELSKRINDKAKEIIESNNALFLTPLIDKTIVIELSRGSSENASMPLTGPEGYQYVLPLLGQEILKDLSIIYLNINQKESFKRNLERPFNIPEGVMRRNYSCDDMLYLLNGSSFITLESENKSFKVPVAIFDANKVDTSFIYKPQYNNQKEYKLFLEELKQVTAKLFNNK